MTKRRFRDYTFKMLFHAEFYDKENLEEQIALFLQEECGSDEFNEEASREILTEEDCAALLQRVRTILPLVPEIDKMIEQYSEGWKLSRIGKVELAILRLGIYEMKYDESVAEGLAINEAVELGKMYAGDDSYKFINAILGKIARANEA
ncbi:MAG: transcription antitermination factor NusB [Lachnospiraceae bacterium]